MKTKFTLCALLLSLNFLFAQISLVQFSTGYTAAVDIKNAGDSRLFIVQQNGLIYISNSAGVKKSKPFLDISSRVVFNGEQGLLGLAFDPDYIHNGYFYVDYTAAGSGATHISRFS